MKTDNSSFYHVQPCTALDNNDKREFVFCLPKVIKTHKDA